MSHNYCVKKRSLGARSCAKLKLLCVYEKIICKCAASSVDCSSARCCFLPEGQQHESSTFTAQTRALTGAVFLCDRNAKIVAATLTNSLENPLLDQSGQRWILARDGLSANDPKRTLAV